MCSVQPGMRSRVPGMSKALPIAIAWGRPVELIGSTEQRQAQHQNCSALLRAKAEGSKSEGQNQQPAWEKQSCMQPL